LHCYVAGYFTRVVAAHSIGHDKQAQLFVYMQAIFIGFANHT